MEKCILRRKWLRNEDHHFFEDFYDIDKESLIPENFKFNNFTSSDIEACKTNKTSQTYIKSVCRYCGKEILR
jgi:hypothetical protein